MSLLYPAQFATNGFVQFWYSFQTTVAGGMGMMGFFYPNTPVITMGGYWQYVGEEDPTNKKNDSESNKNNMDKKVVLAPNVRSWGIRNAFPAVVNILGLYFGTRETYYMMAAVAIWREFFDICEAIMDGDTDKIFFPTKVGPGKVPPLPYFPPWGVVMIGNLTTLYMIATAKDN